MKINTILIINKYDINNIRSYSIRLHPYATPTPSLSRLHSQRFSLKPGDLGWGIAN